MDKCNTEDKLRDQFLISSVSDVSGRLDANIADHKKAVLSVPLHDLDYKHSTLEQKRRHHQYFDQGSDSGCQFQAHFAAGLPEEEFERHTASHIGPDGPVTIE